MVKYLRVTDNKVVGYHSVDDDFRLPYAAEHEEYVWVEEVEAREQHPALFGAVEASAPVVK
jgi:hypothetical protein